jgi:hypothetical protein
VEKYLDLNGMKSGGNYLRYTAFIKTIKNISAFAPFVTHMYIVKMKKVYGEIYQNWKVEY